MNKDNYIIVDKTKLLKRIEELENITSAYSTVKELKEILSQSIPLIPEIEKAFDAGGDYATHGHDYKVLIPHNKQKYINDLNLEI